MPQVLQLAELVELDGVAEVEVRTRGIEPLLDPQRLAASELCRELALDDQLVGAALEHGQVVVDVEGHGSCRRGLSWRRQGRAGRIAASPGTRTMAAHKARILAQSTRAALARAARVMPPRLLIA